MKASNRAPADVVLRLQKLKETVEHHRFLYHVLDQEEISPEALDSLKNELREIEEKYPELLKEIHKHGHEIANHTYNHKNLTTLSITEVISELSRTRLLIKDITGVDTYLYTPPGGQYNSRVIKEANSCGYKMALWSVFPEDHRNPPPVIYEKVVSKSRDGSVVLLHNGPPDTIDALPKIIEKLKARDFKFTTLSELLTQGKGKHIVYPRD